MCRGKETFMQVMVGKKHFDTRFVRRQLEQGLLFLVRKPGMGSDGNRAGLVYLRFWSI